MAAVGVVVALLDTSVLFPFYLRDTLLRAAEMDLFQARWSRDILAELRRSLVARDKTSRAQVDHLLRTMRAAFPDAEEAGYRPLIKMMTNHPDDRHVLAAAVHAQAEVIVTSNLRHFPNSSVAPYGIRVQSADAFLLERLDQSPDQMTRILWDQAGEYRSPRLSTREILDRLATTVPRYAAAVGEML